MGSMSQTRRFKATYSPDNYSVGWYHHSHLHTLKLAILIVELVWVLLCRMYEGNKSYVKKRSEGHNTQLVLAELRETQVDKMIGGWTDGQGDHQISTTSVKRGHC